MRLALPFLLLLAACSPSPPMDPACDPTQGPCRISHDFGALTLSPGQEVPNMCYSWTLNNPTDLWVNLTELANDGAVHHSNWFYVPDSQFQHDDGKWDCDQVHFDELGAALVGGVLAAQSTQSRSDAQRFPQGAAVRVPAYARIIGDVHLLNPAAKAVTTGIRLAITTVKPGPDVVLLAPFRLSYLDLQIPPMADSQFSGTCDLRSAYAEKRKDPFHMVLYYALPHYHTLGRTFTLQTLGGPDDGKTLFALDSGVGDSLSHPFDPPVDLGAANGLTFTCGFHNPRAQAVHYGIGDQEMCEMLGFIQSPVAYDAGVLKTGPASGTAFTGPCQVASFYFSP